MDEIQIYLVVSRYGTTAGGVNNAQNIDLSPNKYLDSQTVVFPVIDASYILHASKMVDDSDFTNNSKTKLTDASLNEVNAAGYDKIKFSVPQDPNPAHQRENARDRSVGERTRRHRISQGEHTRISHISYQQQVRTNAHIVV